MLKKWTGTIGFEDLLQCFSIYVSANLIKWENIELMDEEKKAHPLRQNRSLDRQEARGDLVIILKGWKIKSDKEE